jgi:hypothetical protein
MEKDENRLAKVYPHSFSLALKAVDKIISNLNMSDFGYSCGTNTIKELENYRLYIAIDIAKIFEPKLGEQND